MCADSSGSMSLLRYNGQLPLASESPMPCLLCFSLWLPLSPCLSSLSLTPLTPCLFCSLLVSYPPSLRPSSSPFAALFLPLTYIR